MTNNIKPISNPPKHHFFGFHDLPAWNYIGDKLLCLEVDVINRPPIPKDNAGVGYITNNNFIKLGTTNTFNFPQGARMQWLGHTENFIVNNSISNTIGCDLYDTETNKKIDSFDFSCHQIHKNCRTTFSINYSRLFRLGAYGYAGHIDHSKGSVTPNNDGIFIGDIINRTNRLLISIFDVANFQNENKNNTGEHYLTHLLLNPSNNRLAFLHRYPLADGGEMTRLMTISIDGTDLRCLATGFLSHYDWKDDDTILIFGRANNSLDNIRSSRFFSNPLILKTAIIAKNIIRTFYSKTYSINSNFLLIKDSSISSITKCAIGLIKEDGHPMICPINRDWMICDNYPDNDGVRTLFLFNIITNKRIDLGRFQMIFEKPSLNLKNDFFEGVEKSCIDIIGENNLSFTRSGLHCDLHPRWDMKGEKIAFDSIHDGTRQVYEIDIKKLNIL